MPFQNEITIINALLNGCRDVNHSGLNFKDKASLATSIENYGIDENINTLKGWLNTLMPSTMRFNRNRIINPEKWLEYSQILSESLEDSLEKDTSFATITRYGLELSNRAGDYLSFLDKLLVHLDVICHKLFSDYCKHFEQLMEQVLELTFNYVQRADLIQQYQRHHHEQAQTVNEFIQLTSSFEFLSDIYLGSAYFDHFLDYSYLQYHKMKYRQHHSYSFRYQRDSNCPLLVGYDTVYMRVNQETYKASLKEKLEASKAGGKTISEFLKTNRLPFNDIRRFDYRYQGGGDKEYEVSYLYTKHNSSRFEQSFSKTENSLKSLASKYAKNMESLSAPSPYLFRPQQKNLEFKILELDGDLRELNIKYQAQQQENQQELEQLTHHVESMVAGFTYMVKPICSVYENNTGAGVICSPLRKLPEQYAGRGLPISIDSFIKFLEGFTASDDYKSDTDPDNLPYRLIEHFTKMKTVLENLQALGTYKPHMQASSGKTEKQAEELAFLKQFQDIYRSTEFKNALSNTIEQTPVKEQLESMLQTGYLLKAVLEYCQKQVAFDSPIHKKIDALRKTADLLDAAPALEQVTNIKKWHDLDALLAYQDKLTEIKQQFPERNGKDEDHSNQTLNNAPILHEKNKWEKLVIRANGLLMSKTANDSDSSFDECSSVSSVTSFTSATSSTYPNASISLRRLREQLKSALTGREFEAHINKKPYKVKYKVKYICERDPTSETGFATENDEVMKLKVFIRFNSKEVKRREITQVFHLKLPEQHINPFEYAERIHRQLTEEIKEGIAKANHLSYSKEIITQPVLLRIENELGLSRHNTFFQSANTNQTEDEIRDKTLSSSGYHSA